MLIEVVLVMVLDICVVCDVIRGGLVFFLNEMVEVVGVSIEIDEIVVFFCVEVKGICEIFGLDLFYFVNEGMLVMFVFKV